MEKTSVNILRAKLVI
uniref:Uncharacterized protein n=1 Tax=Anguilla anguilla TaxID=7936 RepID=A0A0E9U7C0_ANGAN